MQHYPTWAEIGVWSLVFALGLLAMCIDTARRRHKTALARKQKTLNWYKAIAAQRGEKWSICRGHLGAAIESNQDLHDRYRGLGREIETARARAKLHCEMIEQQRRRADSIAADLQPRIVKVNQPKGQTMDSPTEPAAISDPVNDQGAENADSLIAVAILLLGPAETAARDLIADGEAGKAALWAADRIKVAIDALGQARIAARVDLKEAIGLIRFFHGRPAWETYYDHSPEMKRLRAAAGILNSEVDLEPAWPPEADQKPVEMADSTDIGNPLGR